MREKDGGGWEGSHEGNTRTLETVQKRGGWGGGAKGEHAKMQREKTRIDDVSGGCAGESCARERRGGCTAAAAAAAGKRCI